MTNLMIDGIKRDERISEWSDDIRFYHRAVRQAVVVMVCLVGAIVVIAGALIRFA